MFILTLAQSFPAQYALTMCPGGVGRCNAASAPNVPIEGAHYSLHSTLKAVSTPGAVLIAASLLLLEGSTPTSTMSFS